ncbi:MAG TPA: DUF1993 domain-containing protein [Polyangia bacterium]|nr:DUF1993 domain-containing protein [Polyangia bacterium]
MYYMAIQQLARTLRNLDAILGKAEAHAKARGFDVDNFLTARLAPDMLPFAKQIRIACDHAKSVAQALSGKELPKHEDNEATFAELRGRIAKCLAVLDGLSAADFAATKGDAIVKMPNRPGKGMRADEYLWRRQIPNFYFHVTTAYALLRAGGVEIGKSDFLGPLEYFDL